MSNAGTQAGHDQQHGPRSARASNRGDGSLPTPELLPGDDGGPSGQRRGRHRGVHADALNVLAQLERDANNLTAAIQAATEAYEKAWCDGPPFACHWGLEKAKAHLAALGAPEPVLPPFDESKYGPMPDVQI